MAEIVQQFNEQTAPARRAESQSAAWPETAFVALARWYATQLPDSYTLYDSNREKDAPEVKVTITEQHRQDFIVAMAAEMKKLPPAKNRFGSEYIEIDSAIDFGSGTTNPPVWDALEKAGIGDAFTELELVKTYIHKDGQVFVKGAPLDHEGRPQIQYTRERDVDFTGCPWMRQDSRYLVTPLETGQTVTGVRRGKGGVLTYRDYIAKEGDVLVIPAFACEDFSGLTQSDALNLRYRDNIRLSLIGKASEYCDGAKTPGGSMEQLDGSGHFRRLSNPFQIFTAQTPFATGYDSEYHVMKPGDCITRTPEGDKGWASHEIVPKEWMDNNRRTFLPSAPDGTLLDLTKLDKPVSTLKPLKFSPKAST